MLHLETLQDAYEELKKDLSVLGEHKNSPYTKAKKVFKEMPPLHSSDHNYFRVGMSAVIDPTIGTSELESHALARKVAQMFAFEVIEQCFRIIALGLEQVDLSRHKAIEASDLNPNATYLCHTSENLNHKNLIERDDFPEGYVFEVATNGGDIDEILKKSTIEQNYRLKMPFVLNTRWKIETLLIKT